MMDWSRARQRNAVGGEPGRPLAAPRVDFTVCTGWKWTGSTK